MHAKYVKNSYFMKINTKKLHVQKMFVSSTFLESGTTDFPSWPACLSVDLDRKISHISLDSTVFVVNFFYKIEIFKNLSLAKIITREIRFF